MSNKPLWLPEGSIRAILALVIVGSAIASVFLLESSDAAILIGLAGAVTAFYFEQRRAE